MSPKRLDIRTLYLSTINCRYRSFGGGKSYWSKPASNVRFGIHKYNIRDYRLILMTQFVALAIDR